MGERVPKRPARSSGRVRLRQPVSALAAASRRVSQADGQMARDQWCTYAGLRRCRLGSACGRGGTMSPCRGVSRTVRRWVAADIEQIGLVHPRSRQEAYAAAE